MSTGRSAFRTSALRRVTWVLWPWLNWLLPIAFGLFCVWRVLDTRGSTALVIAFASPLLIPVTALLAALPRRILRDRGVEATPRATVCLLMLQWWCWLGIALSLPDEQFTDAPESAPVPSLLQQALGGSSAYVFSIWVLVASLILGIGSWGATIVLSEHPIGYRHMRRWDHLGAAAVLAAPLILAAVGAVGVGLSQLRQDTAGEHPALAVSRTAEEQVMLAQRRYAHIQDALTPLRAQLAESGWSVERADVERVDATGAAPVAYRFHIAFSHATTGDLIVDQSAVVDVLLETGWDVSVVRDAPLRIDASRADGTSLILGTNGDRPLHVTVETGIWWQSADEPVTTELDSPGGAAGGGYDADDWPELR